MSFTEQTDGLGDTLCVHFSVATSLRECFQTPECVVMEENVQRRGCGRCYGKSPNVDTSTNPLPVGVRICV